MSWKEKVKVQPPTLLKPLKTLDNSFKKKKKNTPSAKAIDDTTWKEPKKADANNVITGEARTTEPKEIIFVFSSLIV